LPAPATNTGLTKCSSSVMVLIGTQPFGMGSLDGFGAAHRRSN
jgi:hypothetical protein